MQRLDAAKREAILNAAKQRLSRYGVQKTTMQEIAKDASIAVGTLYLYFKNKDEILIATAEAYAQQHFADVETILKSKLSPPDKLKAYLVNRAVQENRLSGSHAAELARAVIRLKPQLQQQQSEQVKTNVLSILQEGIQSKLFNIENLERDLEVFLYSIGYFFPLPTTEQYYESEEEKLCLVVEWFIKQWCLKREQETGNS